MHGQWVPGAIPRPGLRCSYLHRDDDPGFVADEHIPSALTLRTPDVRVADDSRQAAKDCREQACPSRHLPTPHEPVACPLELTNYTPQFVDVEDHELRKQGVAHARVGWIHGQDRPARRLGMGRHHNGPLDPGTHATFPVRYCPASRRAAATPSFVTGTVQGGAPKPTNR